MMQRGCIVTMIARLGRIWHRLVRRLARVRAGLDTPQELVLVAIDRIMLKISGRSPDLFPRHASARLLRRGFKEDGCYRFLDARVALLPPDRERELWSMYEDMFMSYVELGDSYDVRDVGQWYDLLHEGFYCLVDEGAGVDVRVMPGDIVIDAGSWIGDFAAYASAKGATVYAFEPVGATFPYLEETAALNFDIHPVRKALGDETSTAHMYVEGTSSSNTFSDWAKGLRGTEEIRCVTLDDFVQQEGLARVDFIKADVEGSERALLKGARETLRRFSPKLAICTYHLPDDPEVLEKLIKDICPSYKVVQKRKKLYACV